MNELFSRIAHRTSYLAGRAYVFIGAVAVIILWAITGPIFGFSDTWQLIINTGTTIITFLMVFLIQNTQNRDTQAIQLKLDELIRVTREARNNLIDLEDAPEEMLQEAKKEFTMLKDETISASEERLREIEEDLEEAQGDIGEVRQTLAEKQRRPGE